MGLALNKDEDECFAEANGGDDILVDEVGWSLTLCGALRRHSNGYHEGL